MPNRFTQSSALEFPLHLFIVQGERFCGLFALISLSTFFEKKKKPTENMPTSVNRCFGVAFSHRSAFFVYLFFRFLLLIRFVMDIFDSFSFSTKKINLFLFSRWVVLILRFCYVYSARTLEYRRAIVYVIDFITWCLLYKNPFCLKQCQKNRFFRVSICVFAARI